MSGAGGAHENVPSAAAVVTQKGRAYASATVIEANGSAVPVTVGCVLLVGLCGWASVGAAGVCVSSMNVIEGLGAPVTFAGVVCVACTVYCVAGAPTSGVPGWHCQLPLEATVPVQRTAPEEPVLDTVTVSPGTPRPVKVGCGFEV